ncbi:MAG TPA: zinc ribbon domain-containing protein [Spirochaetota bacterium]|nr:zinc ribbon domain-containing protein [Spirochaetota bacterium]
MDETLKNLCPSCGLAYDEASAFCSRCGYKFDSDKKLLGWKWVFISMVSLVLFQILVLAVTYYMVFLIAGPESFMRNMLVIPYTAIPAAVFTGSFIFSYIFIRSSAVDAAAGMVIFLLLSNTVNFIFLDSFSFKALAWIPVIAALAYAGAWAAKKFKLHIASRRNKSAAG